MQFQVTADTTSACRRSSSTTERLRKGCRRRMDPTHGSSSAPDIGEGPLPRVSASERKSMPINPPIYSPPPRVCRFMTGRATASLSRGPSGGHSARPPRPHPVRSHLLLDAPLYRCRPSQALALTADRVDFQATVLTFENKKKRRPGLTALSQCPAAHLMPSISCMAFATAPRRHSSGRGA